MLLPVLSTTPTEQRDPELVVVLGGPPAVLLTPLALASALGLDGIPVTGIGSGSPAAADPLGPADIATEQVGRSPRIRWVAPALALLIATMAFTSPGRAAVEWAAERVGIAEVGDEPTLPDRRINGGSAFTVSDSGGEVKPNFKQQGPAVVIGSGEAPDGTPFELVAYTAKEATCASIEVPTLPRSSPSCYADGIGALGLGTGGGHFPIPDDPLPANPVFYGQVGSKIERVEIRYINAGSSEEGLTAATIFPLDARLARALDGHAEQFATYLAFLPDSVTSEEYSIELRAYSADGELRQLRKAPPVSAPSEIRSDLDTEHQRYLDLLRQGLAVVSAGEFAAEIDRARSLQILDDALALEEGARILEGKEASRLEDGLSSLLAALQEAGDIPPSRP